MPVTSLLHQLAGLVQQGFECTEAVTKKKDKWQVCSRKRLIHPYRVFFILGLWLGGEFPFNWDCNVRMESVDIYKRDGRVMLSHLVVVIIPFLVPSGGSV